MMKITGRFFPWLAKALTVYAFGGIIGYGLATADGNGVATGDSPGVPTWLRSDSGTGVLIDSRIEGTKVRLTDASDQIITSAEGLKKAGWLVKPDGFWETPVQAGGERINFIVSGLPPGVHKVYLRYFTKPRADGETWWYATPAYFQGAMQWLTDDTPGRRLIAGKGGQDPGTVYEVLLGTAGTPGDPTDHVEFGVSRYEWSQISRLGPFRIESFPAMNALTPSESASAEELLSPCASLSFGANGVLRWGVVSSMVKVRPAHLDSLARIPIRQTVDLFAAQGERESAQIVLHASDTLQVGNLAVSPLLLQNQPPDATPVSIPSDHILIAPMGYVAVSNQDNMQQYGYWPDPIMTHLKQFTLEKGLIQSIWVRVDVPVGATPGEYKATISFTVNGTPAAVPLDFRVRGFAISRRSLLPFLGGSSSDFLMGYGISPGSIYGFPPGDPVATFKDWAKDHPAFYPIGYFPGTSGFEWEKDFPNKRVSDDTLQKWAQSIQVRLDAAKASGIEGRPYIYLWDEAPVAWRPALQQTIDYLRPKFPDLFMITTSAVPNSAGRDRTYDAWVALTGQIDSERAAAFRRSGKELWLYVCNSPNPPYDNVFVTSKGSGTRRLTGWLPESLRAKGFLYYSFGVNDGTQPVVGDEVFTPWRVIADGDGDFLIRGPNGPLPTQRLELLHDGLEDYSYASTASRLLSQLKDSSAVSPELHALVPEVRSILAENATQLIDPAPEYKRIQRDVEWREKLADFIELAQERSK